MPTGTTGATDIVVEVEGLTSECPNAMNCTGDGLNKEQLDMIIAALQDRQAVDKSIWDEIPRKPLNIATYVTCGLSVALIAYIGYDCYKHRRSDKNQRTENDA